MPLSIPDRLRTLTRKEILIGGSVAVSVLAIGLGLVAAPKLDDRPPMQPVSQERMQILVAANAPAAPLPAPAMTVGAPLEVLPPGAVAAAAPPRPLRAAYVPPTAMDAGRDAYAVTREDRPPEVIRGDPRDEGPGYDERRYEGPRYEGRRRHDRDRYEESEEPPADEDAPPDDMPDEAY